MEYLPTEYIAGRTGYHTLYRSPEMGYIFHVPSVDYFVLITIHIFFNSREFWPVHFQFWTRVKKLKTDPEKRPRHSTAFAGKT